MKEFGGVRVCEKPIGLSRFTVLIGPNNSAKTTVLLALFLAPYPLTTYKGHLCHLPLIESTKHDFLREFLDKSEESLIYRYSGRGEINCVFKGKPLKLSLSKDEWFKVASGQFEGEAVAKDLGFEDALSLASYVLFIPNSDSFRRRLEEKLVRRWEDVEKTGAHVKLVRELISKVVDDRLTEVNIRRHSLVVRKELPNDIAYIKLKDMGDGVERFLISSLWLETVKPQVVLWDDLEASAHPSLIREILTWLASHDWQVVFSTHSIDVLEAFANADIKDGKVILQGIPEEILTPDNIKRIYELRHVTFSHKLGLIEMLNESSSPLFHIVCGAGTGCRIMRYLAKKNISFTAGVLHEGDLDFEAAVALAYGYVSEKPYAEICCETLENALRLAEKSLAIIDTGFPIGHINRRNLEILKLDKEIISFRNPEEAKQLGINVKTVSSFGQFMREIENVMRNSPPRRVHLGKRG